jgi:hypothetical protein
MPQDPKGPKELSKEEMTEVRKKIVESIITQLRRPGGGFYGYTQSAGNNYGKYERE